MGRNVFKEVETPKSPWEKLAVANQRIAELEAELAKLVEYADEQDKNIIAMIADETKLKGEVTH